ncbi:hypothetical protein PVT68_09650 [Microbulbifer bruguierae]|uniref:Uncharacterized protein n=1 Tax=Microbulbifer bruguierae TaxID=3029061 RepID=A0ABY8N821_9GAMM|nr:hypothetical protein [Microbulbifer bruguierae]WGL15044.1 hypothetical protein PVT68_09650 [Microbulbifer bruguierae]
MDQTLFLNEVERRLALLFKASQSGYPIPAIERHRLEGFMQAGIFLGLSSKADLAQLMERIHLEIFGKTLAERKQQPPASWIFAEVDYSQYESPSYVRTRSET